MNSRYTTHFIAPNLLNICIRGQNFVSVGTRSQKIGMNEKFEVEHYPSQNRSIPHSRLLHLMDTNDLQPADLVSIFGSSDRAIEVINGTQAIDLTQAEKLSDRFNLPSKLFLA
jgi:antitoxin component HigA of HigAB toxin-antitoxin module